MKKSVMDSYNKQILNNASNLIIEANKKLNDIDDNIVFIDEARDLVTILENVESILSAISEGFYQISIKD